MTGDFHLSTDGCAGQTVAPGQTCAVEIAFAPLASGERSGVLELVTNADPAIAAVQLTGAGTPPPAPPPPAPPSPAPPSPAPPPPLGGRAALAVADARVTARGRTVLRLRCAGAPGTACAGDIELRAAQNVAPRRAGTSRRTRGSGGRVRRPRLGRSSYAIAAGATQSVTVRLNAAGRQALSSRRRLRATATFRPVSGPPVGQQEVTLISRRAPVTRISSRRARLNRRGRVAVKLRCRARRGARCSGRLRLTTHARGRARLAGSRRYRLRGGRTATVRVRLRRWARARLGRSGRLVTRARATTTIPVGPATKRSRRITVRL